MFSPPFQTSETGDGQTYECSMSLCFRRQKVQVRNGHQEWASGIQNGLLDRIRIKLQLITESNSRTPFKLQSSST
jgi:hypothetical protein